jgi:hypothetical protein
MLYSSTSNVVYNPQNYSWPVFSIKNYVQGDEGWFHYRKKQRVRKNKQIDNL